VAETDGLDKNGDGDLFDRVAELYDPRTDRLVNTQVAAAALPVFSGRIMGFLGSELEQGADLNGDGDLFDTVAFVTVPAGVTTELQEAIDLRAAAGGDFLLARRESEASIDGNGIDWNHDGDTDDVVVHVFDPLTRVSINTQIASVDTLGASAHQLLLYVDEASERRDLNLDGDQLDQVFVLFDLDTLTSTSVGVAGAPDATHFGRLSASGHFTLLANESAQGRDLDGDGDLFDDVLHRAQ
jgi:hypothetical protein